jgi:hypothetical protein
MKFLSFIEYKNLTDGAKDLTTEKVNGIVVPKVLLLNDMTILKMFRLKKFFTSARINPYVSRFQHNVQKLVEYRIPTVDIINLYEISEIRRTAVHYRPLPGPTLREFCDASSMNKDLAFKFGEFLFFLHNNGVYFRSIHFGNIILTAQNKFGLIDVVDTRFKKAPLNLSFRIRNLRHLFRYQTDIDHIAPVKDVFLKAYFKNSTLNHKKEMKFRYYFEKYFYNKKMADR